ncbi:MAG: agl cluster protein AglQ [Deltaproteobacteria bacterium]|jgi:hypothetical protein|nr:agl cluster protein AglQ [Deltaproteobacteria bacterium]
MPSSLFRFLHHCAEAALPRQRADGAMPGGCNGPWEDAETPVRNTGHWLITFLRVLETTGDPRFRAAAEKSAAYLLSDAARPMGASFWHRMNPERDFCNGLIGSAWTIEALAAAGDALGMEEAFGAAREVFLLHPYLEDEGVWRVVNVDGSRAGVDPTFNHQLWFAASGALLVDRTGDAVIRERVGGFMDHLGWSFQVRSNGAIVHGMRFRSLPRRLYQEFGIRRQGRAYWKAQVPKEIGYHAFNLMGFGLLHSSTSEHSFWRSDSFARAMALVGDTAFRDQLETSPYGYPYNPPGFEVPFAVLTFPALVDESTRAEENLSAWVDRQLAHTWSPETRQLDRNVPDAATLTARLYEAARLPDLPLEHGVDG